MTIKITNVQSLFSLPVNFTDWKDISPENLTTTFEALGEALLNIQRRLSDVAIYIDSSIPGQINFPKLPKGCTWYKDQDDNIVALPISSLYEKFSEMINILKGKIDKYIEENEVNISGATYIPTVDSDGNISWANDKDRPNPPTTNIKGPAGTIEQVTASITNSSGIPTVTVTETGTPENRSFNLDFKNLKGDKPVKGVDYLTREEQEQFSKETVGLVEIEGKKVIEEVKNIVGTTPEAGNAITLGGKTRSEFESDVELVSDIQTFGIKTFSNKIKHLNNLDKKYVTVNKYNGFIKLNVDETFPKERGIGFSVDIGLRSSLENKIIYLYRNEVGVLDLCQLSTNDIGWGSPIYNVTLKPVPYEKNLYYINGNDIIDKIPQEVGNVYLILYDSSKFEKLGENVYNIFIESENKINYDSSLNNNIINLNSDVNLFYDEIIKKTSTKQKGFLTSDGTYFGEDKGYYSQSISYICKEKDVFLYKGVGESMAYSYLMKNENEIVNKGQIKSKDKYVEVEIPNGVNNIIFSSYAKKENEVIFDVKRKTPAINDRVSYLEKLVYDNDFKETSQKGYLNSEGGYQGTSSFSKTIIYPCSEGDVFLYKGKGVSSAYSYLMRYGNEIINRGQFNSLDRYTEVLIPNGIDNIIFSSYATLEEDVVLEVKRKNPKDLENRVANIESKIGEYYGNVLANKKWVACGDSFTAGGFTGFVDENGLSEKDSPVIYDKEWGMYKTYPWWIAKRNGMILKNEAIAGSIMALSKQYLEGTQAIGYKQPFSYERYKRIPADADYITIWFGINDASNTNLGTINDTDNTTFYGAWNVVLEWLITNRPYAKIGIVITNLSKETYRKATREVAEKWGIPYLDMMGDKKVPVIFGRENNLGLDDKAYQLRLNSFRVSETNFHPNIKAHEYQSTFIENFLKSL